MGDGVGMKGGREVRCEVSGGFRGLGYQRVVILLAETCVFLCFFDNSLVA